MAHGLAGRARDFDPDIARMTTYSPWARRQRKRDYLLAYPKVERMTIYGPWAKS